MRHQAPNKLVLGLLIALGFAFFAPTSASAQARHLRVSVKPIKAKGKVVGAHIKAQLQPADGYNKVQLVLGKVDPGKYSGANYRDAATGKTKGYVLHKGESKSNPQNGDPIEMKVEYGKGPFKGGEKVDVTSVWSKNGGAAHIWGMTRNGVSSKPETLPAAD